MIKNICNIALILFVLAGSVLIFSVCATIKPATVEEIRTEMAAIIRDINTNRNVINSLGNRRVGKTGYYYILDSDGRVVFHPRQALIGSTFNRTWFINQLLTERSGCLTYTLGNRTHYLFFSPINDSEILCLSIVSEDLPNPVECKAAEVR